MFDIHPTKSYGLTNRDLFETIGKIPVVCNSEENNGIKGYVNLEPTETANTITFSDTTTADSIFLQDSDFIGYSHVQGLYPYSDKWIRNSLLYFIANFKYVAKQYNFDYANKFNRAIALDMLVLLPTINNQLAFDYMEQYIQELELEQIHKLDDYLKSIGLNDYELTDEEKAVLENKEIEFKEFRVGDLFEVKNNPQLNKEHFIFSDKGNYPYFTRTTLNNGILGYVEYLNEKNKIQGSSIAVGMLGMKFFYMEHDFYAGQFTKTIYPKFKNFNKSLALYFISLFNNYSEIYKGVLVRNFEKTFKNTIILLPTTNNQPDFKYMETYISAISKLVIANVVKWKDNILKDTNIK